LRVRTHNADPSLSLGNFANEAAAQAGVVSARCNVLEKMWRFKDLKEANIFPNRMALSRAEQRGEIDPGIMLSPNARAWTDTMVQDYLKSRPRRTPGIWRAKNLPRVRAKSEREADRAREAAAAPCPLP
jgi:hypothetical protein